MTSYSVLHGSVRRWVNEEVIDIVHQVVNAAVIVVLNLQQKIVDDLL